MTRSLTSPMRRLAAARLASACAANSACLFFLMQSPRPWSLLPPLPLAMTAPLGCPQEAAVALPSEPAKAAAALPEAPLAGSAGC
jgi:hypothetical protein